jgi:ABC-type transport system involved in cytochrome c biogenesis permease component
MLEAVTSGLTTVISWIGTVISAMTTTNGNLAPLLPLFAIGISISVVFLGVKVIKSVVWGA